MFLAEEVQIYQNKFKRRADLRVSQLTNYESLTESRTVTDSLSHSNTT
jgi:hypothetical protein